MVVVETHQALENYRQLATKVDDKFIEIHARYRAAFQCQKGCHSCCQPGLTVSPVEREVMRVYLQASPALINALEALETEDPRHGTRCRFLDRNID